MFGGTVIKGEGVGRQLGYPTANLGIAPKDVKLKDGVYAARATVGHGEYAAALVIQHEAKKVEVHLLDYHGPELYGAYLSVEPVQKVSEIEEKEGNALLAKIARDIELVKEVLRGNA